VEVKFVNESLDLASRGGRLTADLQAIIAADFIRNLREETRKGFYGRLKQGFYPLPAPLGYRDMGKAKAKEFDLVRAPLVRRAFELYGEGSWSIDDLREELHRSGLRTRAGGKISKTTVSVLLNNPFYIGIIRLQTGETFRGVHKPLIAKSLFDRVQLTLRGKAQAKTQIHGFRFRRLFTCSNCGYSLIGETQKGNVYYRCHSKACRRPPVSIREEVVENAVSNALEPLRFDVNERAILRDVVGEIGQQFEAQRLDETNSAKLQLGKLNERQNSLTDAYIDKLITRETFEKRQASILMEEKGIQERMRQPQAVVVDRLSKFLELAEDLYLLYKIGFPEEKRDLLKIVTSNRIVSSQNVVVTLSPPFQEVAKRHDFSNGGRRLYRSHFIYEPPSVDTRRLTVRRAITPTSMTRSNNRRP
jgi:hypothetical protein